MLLGLSPVHTPVMPVLSSWNTPSVRPAASISNVSGSSSGICSTAKPGTLRRTSRAASSSTVRLRRPRKSIFSSPSSSSVVIGNWQTTDSSFFASGTYSYTGFSVMTTPAACVEAWRGMPSKARAVSIRLCRRSSESYISRSGLESFKASSSVMFSVLGTCFATASVSAYVRFSARPTSRMAALAAMVPNVTICATWSEPYFRFT